MTPLRTIIACVALALVFWRLGDSPCGCARHNLWFSAHDDHEDTPLTDPAVDHGCEGEGVPLVDVPRSTEGPPPHAVTGLGDDLASAPTAIVASATPHAETRSRGRPERPDAARLRAELQILLI